MTKFSSKNVTAKSTLVFLILLCAGVYVLTSTDLNEYLRTFICIFLFAGSFVALGINDDFVISVFKEMINFRKNDKGTN